MLQRQIMFKQLEELQRQKKLQELNDSRQQNVLNQQALIHNKQAFGAQYAPLVNGTPVRDPSQMFMFGNTNLVQGFQNGLPYSQAQNQVLHSMSLASQLVDGPHFNRFSHFQGANRESNDGQFKVPYQERNMLGPVFSQGVVDMGAQTGNDQQEYGNWAGNVLEKAMDINPSEDFTTLDPLEQKILFDTDDNNLGGFGNMLEDTDNLQALPSLQNGGWSALMQSALEETSSTDTGIQEEWSGLSFQNPDLPNDNQPCNFMESGKHSTPWQTNVFQNAPTLNSKSEHLKTSNASSGFPGFQQFHELNPQSHKETGEFERSAQVQRFSHLQVHQGPSGHAGEFEFVNDASNNGREFKKGFLPDNQSRMSAIVDTSSSFSAPDSNAQTSHHMLELFRKVDKFRDDRYGTSHTVPLKNQDGQSSSIFETPQPLTALTMGQQVSNSTRQPSVWVDIPSQQNLSVYKAPSGSPSTSDVANRKIEFENASEAPKESDSQIYVNGTNDLSEGSGHMMNSQSFNDGRTYINEESSSGRAEANGAISARHLEAFGRSLKQANISPLNPAYSEPNVRASLKSERVDSDTKFPPQLTSVYENYRTLPVKTSSHPPLQDASQIHRNSSFVQMNLASTSQYGNVWPVTRTNSVAVNQLSPPLDAPNQDLLVPKSKKRKLPTYELLPWHKEATKGSSRLHDMSIAELEWAQAANRLPEQLKEGEALGDSHWMVRPKKKIILTTQLMQVLFRPAPAAILSNDATTCYNTVTYLVARLALGDACSLAYRDISDSPLGENVISKGSGDQNLLKIVEDFIDRSKKLEDEFLRLENGGSILEIRTESQDLERFSVINRFAKFHSRAQMVAADTASSGGGSTVPKLYPQRYVTASPMPRIVPEGHNCLLL